MLGLDVAEDGPNGGALWRLMAGAAFLTAGEDSLNLWLCGSLAAIVGVGEGALISLPITFVTLSGLTLRRCKCVAVIGIAWRACLALQPSTCKLNPEPRRP